MFVKPLYARVCCFKVSGYEFVILLVCERLYVCVWKCFLERLWVRVSFFRVCGCDCGCVWFWLWLFKKCIFWLCESEFVFWISCVCVCVCLSACTCFLVHVRESSCASVCGFKLSYLGCDCLIVSVFMCRFVFLCVCVWLGVFEVVMFVCVCNSLCGCVWICSCLIAAVHSCNDSCVNVFFVSMCE